MFKKIGLVGISLFIVLFGVFSFSTQVEAQSCDSATFTPTSEEVDCNFGSSCTVSDNCAFTTGIPGGPYQCELQKTTSFKTVTRTCPAGTVVYTDGPCKTPQTIGCGAWQAQTGCTSNADCPNPPETMCATYCTGNAGNPGSCQQVDPSCAAFGGGGFYCGDGYCSAGETNANCASDCPATPPPPDFVLTVDPAQRTITKGGATQYTVTVSPTNGFVAKVALGALCPSSCDITANAHQTPGEPEVVDLSYGAQTATLAVYGTAGIAINNYSIDVTGIGSGAPHHVYPVLKVVPGAPAFMNATSHSACPERSILLSWGAGNYANYYKLYRNTINARPAQPYKTVGNVTSDTDFPAPGSTYYYWVEAAHSPSGNYSAAQASGAVLLPVCASVSPTVSITPSTNSLTVGQTVTFTINASFVSGLGAIGLESTNAAGTPLSNLGETAVNGNSANGTFAWVAPAAGTYYFDGYAWDSARVLLTRTTPVTAINVVPPTATSRIVGKVCKDDNEDGVCNNGEVHIRDISIGACGNPSSPQSGFIINYFGAQNGSKLLNICGSLNDPVFDTANTLLSGQYSVSLGVPVGWSYVASGCQQQNSGGVFVTCSSASTAVVNVSVGGTGIVLFAVKAPPAVTSYTLTVNKTIGGSVTSTDGLISCGSSCTQAYNQGSTVTLLPLPDTVQWRFVGWGGACSGTGNCVVTVDGNKTVTAQFRPRALLYQEF